MKKVIFTIATVSCLLFLNAKQAKAQYTKLLDFNGTTNGGNTKGSLMQATNGMLYGMTYNGGASTNCSYGCGVLFQYNPTTNVYTKKLDFAGTTNGQSPYGSLMQASDGMLYGMTSTGGASTVCTNGCGVLFQYNPATDTYTKKLDFNGTSNGSSPMGSLMQATDGMLYGMTKYGGASTDGILFQYNPITNVYTDKFDFTYTNGTTPLGSLMQASDGMLYGMTSAGGAGGGYGVLFQYNTATNTYTKKLDFAGTTNGRYPYGSLMQATDGMLYGMTNAGGVGGSGVLFQYNTVTNTLTDKFDFTYASGSSPYSSSLIQATDGMLYGMLYEAGANGYGVLFQYNPATSTYTKKLDFAGTTNGINPYGDLMQATNGMLYGMTGQGGASTYCATGCGVLFKYGIGATGINQVANSNEQVSIYPNPNNGSFVIEPNNNTKQTVQMFDINGKLVLSQTINGKTTIDASILSEGVYNICITSNEGIINKKLVIVK